MFAAGLLSAWALLPANATADVLVFKDGDRVQGTLLRIEGETVVFRANRFGDIRVARNDAKVIPEAAKDKAVSVRETPEKSEEVLAGAIPGGTAPPRARSGPRPWTGRLCVSTEAIQDASERRAIVLDAQLSRKAASDQVKGDLHYEYRTQNSEKQNDELKGSAYWKHLLPNRLFSVYRPVIEWNRNAHINGAATPYVVAQQELGIGFSPIQRPNHTVSLGVSENLFNGWALNSPLRVHRRVESVFVESEVSLPWNARLTQRSAVYHSFEIASSGIEHTLEFSRKLTETFSVGLQHQYQRNLPDLRLQNYGRLRLLFGYEF